MTRVPHRCWVEKPAKRFAMATLLLAAAMFTPGAFAQTPAICPNQASQVVGGQGINLSAAISGLPILYSGYDVTWTGPAVPGVTQPVQLQVTSDTSDLEFQIPAMLLSEPGPATITATPIEILTYESSQPPDQTTLQFTILYPPQITGLIPSAVTVGEIPPSVAIGGTNFIPPVGSCTAQSLALANEQFLAASPVPVIDSTQIIVGTAAFPNGNTGVSVLQSPGAVMLSVDNNACPALPTPGLPSPCAPGPPAQSNTMALTVNQLETVISPAELPIGVVGQPYPVTPIVAAGGTSPFRWTLQPPDLGLTIMGTGSTATIQGTPARSGNGIPIVVTVYDSQDIAGIKPIPVFQRYTVTILAPIAPALCPSALSQVSSGQNTPLSVSVSGLPVSLQEYTVTWNGPGNQMASLTVNSASSFQIPAADLMAAGPAVISFTPLPDSDNIPPVPPVGFTVLPPPEIVTLTPNAATSGEPAELNISGGNFSLASNCSPGSIVLINGLPLPQAAFQVVSASQITATLPVSAFAPNSAMVMVQNNGAGPVSLSNSVSLTVNKALGSISATLPNGVVDLPFPATPISVSGGTGPFHWSLQPPSLGLSIVGTGSTATIQGTPTSSGTAIPITVTVYDSGALASMATLVTQPYSVNVQALPAPAITISGGQTFVEINGPTNYPSQITGTLEWSFLASSDVKANPTIADYTVGFGSPCQLTTCQFTIDATTGLFSVPFQVGTTAGTITVTASSIQAAGTTVTPGPSTTMTIESGPPAITSCTQQVTGNPIGIQVNGYSPTREVTCAMFTFTASSGGDLGTTQLENCDATEALFGPYYSSNVNSFLYEQFFAIQGSAAAIGSISVTLASSAGQSPKVTCE